MIKNKLIAFRAHSELVEAIETASNNQFGGNTSKMINAFLRDRLDAEGYLSHEQRIEDQAIAEAKATMETLGAERLLRLLRDARQTAYAEVAP